MLPLIPLLLLLPLAALPDAGPPVIDLARAKRVFDSHCAGCHGPGGAGARGPRLAVPELRNAVTDEELGQVIMWGISGTEMPPFWYLGGDGVMLVASYVRMLGTNATPPQVAGDVVKGKDLYRGKGACGDCHTIGAEGHAYGPDLSTIGARRGAEGLHDVLMKPSATAEDRFMPVRALTREGNKIAGIRVNEDNFTIQILEPSGHLHSFRKEALAELQKYPDESSMPSYKSVFSEIELQDVVAYLSSLRGKP